MMVTKRNQKSEKDSRGSEREASSKDARSFRISAQRRLSSETRLLIGAECRMKEYASEERMARGMWSDPGDDGTSR